MKPESGKQKWIKEVNASPVKIQFVQPMLALAFQKIPEGPDWVYEVKFDGYRSLVGRAKSRVTIWSRRGNEFTEQFPECACLRTVAGRYAA